MTKPSLINDLKSLMQYLRRKIEVTFRVFNTYMITNSKIIIRNLLLILLIFLVLFGFITLIIFSIIRTGKPEVSVPNVTGMDLIEGLTILQKKNLRAFIDPRFFSDHEKDIIVEQQPEAGSVVRENKEINLIVSKGPIISIVEDYSGKTVAYVQNRFQEIFSFQKKAIKIGNITYVTSDRPQGTIIGQYPPPNTPITDVDSVDIIVSRGMETQAFVLDDYRGENINAVMELLALKGILVNVIAESVEEPEKNGIVIAQEPPEGTITGRNDTVSFHVGYLPSEKEKDKLYARVLNFDVPADIEKGTVRIVVKDRAGEREIYHAEQVGGDSLSVPFKSYTDTTVFIYVDEGLYEMRKLE